MKNNDNFGQNRKSNHSESTTIENPSADTPTQNALHTLSLRRYGAMGETIAADFLRNKGYTILARNYTVRGGELDIVARHDGDGVLCFVEVKTRRNRKYGVACASIDAKKLACMQTAAERFLYENQGEPALGALAVRFDVVEVYMQEKLLRHIKGIEL